MNPAQHQKFVTSIQTFSKLNKFQTGIISLLANLTAGEEDLAKLKQVFERLDTDQVGVLTIEKVKTGLEELMHMDETLANGGKKVVCSKHPPEEY